MKFETKRIASYRDKIALYHIVAEGTDEEIGYGLGDLAKNHHQLDKSASTSASHVESQYHYLEKSYPGHYARMSGFARAYGKTLSDLDHDFSFFGELSSGTACSAVYYPPATTIDRRGYISRNLDFSIPNRFASENAIFPFNKTYVIEMYPEKSYPSISLLCFEVFGLALEGINSEGLTVIHLADADTRVDHSSLATNETRRGFNEFLPIQYLLDTCSSADEAMRALKQMEHYHVAIPVHLLIADKHGDSFVFEYSHDGAGKVFVPGSINSPLKVTNFQLSRLSDPTMKNVVESRSAENGFDRYRVLENRLGQAQYPVNEEFIHETNTVVYVHEDDGENLDRTLFHSIYDTSSCALKICLLPEDQESMERFSKILLKHHRKNE